MTTTASGTSRIIVDLGVLASGYVELGVARATGAPIMMSYFADHNAGGALWKADDYDKKLSFDWHPPDRLLGVDSFTNEVYYGALLSLASIERDVARDTHAAGLLEKRAQRVKSELQGNDP